MTTKTSRQTPEKVILIYTAEDGTEYEQPLADITSAGTLVDPESGDDLELTGWRMVTQKNFKN